MVNVIEVGLLLDLKLLTRRADLSFFPFPFFHQRNVKKQLAEPVEFLLNKPTPDMWDKILAQFKETLDRAEGTYLAKAKSESETLLFFPRRSRRLSSILDETKLTTDLFPICFAFRL